MGKKASLIRRVISRLKEECPNCKIPLEVKTELVREHEDPKVEKDLRYEHIVKVYRNTSFCNTC